MNYHIITQDKFFDAYIEDIYKLHQEKDNIFWVRGDKGELPWLHTTREVEYLGNNKTDYIAKLHTLKPEDKLIVSWYDMFIGEAIIASGIQNRVYVWVLGGDFYADPFWYHANWLFDKYTLKSLKESNLYGYPKINWKRRPENWGKIINEIREVHSFPMQQEELYKRKLRTVKRIDFIIMPPQYATEFNQLHRLYPGCNFKMVHAAFDQNFDKAIQMKTPVKESAKLKVLVGNSSDPTNNYIDAYRLLKKKLGGDVEVYSILSYGEIDNRPQVIREGDRLFGKSYHPIIDYMERQTYIDFLNSMDIIVMFHNRQQACGNIMTTITLGKPVFMKKVNPIYDMLKTIGVSAVYDVMRIDMRDIGNVIAKAYAEKESNTAKIAQVYSEEVRLNYWKELLK